MVNANLVIPRIRRLVVGILRTSEPHVGVLQLGEGQRCLKCTLELSVAEPLHAGCPARSDTGLNGHDDLIVCIHCVGRHGIVDGVEQALGVKVPLHAVQCEPCVLGP